jgi:acetyl-CoA carboxylase biotin carboxylase subunit
LSKGRKLLVANRGEIAIRIFRACREMGIVPVAVYSEADRDALHVASADEAFLIGPAPARESYLHTGRILEAARACGADMIHPGYGFLAENAEFARACLGAGLIFVGPSPEAIESMGSKTESRRRMIEAGVPVVPGMSRGATAAELADFGREHGFPILVKASAGGGGKGMRVVRSESEVRAAHERATSEAGAFFGDPTVYAERLVEGARHVEVQVVFDRLGHGLAVGERECSLQRRHQKVVEECPSPVVSPELRAALGEAALSAARAVNYDSCGTVEFLLAPDGKFYFLEMNTRLQVEHPVTEEVYGVDLVALMIAAALGEAIDLDAAALSPRGHAIECRIYAEDAEANFAPSPGRIDAFRPPEGPGIRNDLGVERGSVVPIDYDPMLGKLIVWAPNRAGAVHRLERALAEYEISGIRSTLPVFRALAASAEFQAARFHTAWLDGWLAEHPSFSKFEASDEEVALAAAIRASLGEKRFAAPVAGSVDSHWLRDARRRALR